MSVIDLGSFGLHNSMFVVGRLIVMVGFVPTKGVIWTIPPGRGPQASDNLPQIKGVMEGCRGILLGRLQC